MPSPEDTLLPGHEALEGPVLEPDRTQVFRRLGNWIKSMATVENVAIVTSIGVLTAAGVLIDTGVPQYYLDKLL
jgi:hypothetical protein